MSESSREFNCDHPHRPEYDSIMQQLEKGGLSEENKRLKLAMAGRQTLLKDAPDCLGQLDIGFFFDGTNNNKERDYGPETNPLPFLAQQHSNVVRLFHAFPDEKDENPFRKTIGTSNRIYRYYIPGVGTPFPEIGDRGEGLNSTAGAAAGYGGEARILWAMAQVINSIGLFYKRQNIITDYEAKAAIDNLTSTASFIKRKWHKFTNWASGNSPQMTGDEYQPNFRDAQRVTQFKTWLNEKIKRSFLDTNARPGLAKINIHVFGFSRGAAEARAFVTYLCELVDGVSHSIGRVENDVVINENKTTMSLVGVPCNVCFMGLFDTVASVGMAGVYGKIAPNSLNFSEDHMGWANGTLDMPIGFGIGKCVHMVSAHEVRACFPLDSARVRAQYPHNVEEIVYPGVHSDLGGGYPLRAFGKNDLGDEAQREDLQISRVVCFDMYLRANVAGVPFYSLDEIEKGFPQHGENMAKDILPHKDAVVAMQKYQSMTRDCDTGSVEDQLRKHASLYLGWRWSLGKNYYARAGNKDAATRAADKEVAQTRRNIARLDESAKTLKNPGWRGLFMNKTEASMSAGLIETRLKPDEEKKLAEQEANDQDLRKQFYDKGKYYTGEMKRLDSELTKKVKNKQPHGTGDGSAQREADFMEFTQRALIQVVAGYCHEIDRRIESIGKGEKTNDPLANPLALLSNEKDKVKDGAVNMARKMVISALAKATKADKTAPYAGLSKITGAFTIIQIMYGAADLIKKRISLFSTNFTENAELAKKAPAYLNKWLAVTRENGIAIQHNEISPEREALLLLEALKKWEELPEEKRKILGDFFDDYIHDSAAGFRQSGMREFELNGYCLAKFRNIYFGDFGNIFWQSRVDSENEQRLRDVQKLSSSH